jgi:hypothetical protein
MTVSAYHVLSRVLCRQDGSSLGRCHLKVGDDSHGFDLLGPGKLDMVTDTDWWAWWREARVDSARGSREDLRQGDFNTSHILGWKRLEIRSHKAAIQRGSYVVGVAL